MSKVPDRATHWWTVGHYAMKSSPGFAIWQDGEWLWIGDEFEGSMLELVTKPTKPWSGPEDGLPPTGTVCEHKRVHEWQQIEVFAVKPNYNGSNTALFTYGNGCWGGCAEPSFFRAIPSPAQLRETAIRELMDIAQVDCRVTAARLVDAGFKREGV